MSSLIYHTDERRVLPTIERFKNFELTNLKNTLLNENLTFNDDDIALKLDKWKKNGDKKLGTELISHAFVLNDKDLINTLHSEAKKYKILLPLDINEKEDKKDIIEKINFNKQKLQLEDKDSFTWIDQAINYLSLGNREKAQKSAQTAVNINKNSSYVLRNASRIYSLLGDNGNAIKILKGSEYYKFDPLILSAEISFSDIEGRRTQGVDFGKKVLKDNNLNFKNISELASSIATLDFKKGDLKNSANLFELSLKGYNKNVVAQYLWYKKQSLPTSLLESFKESAEIQSNILSLNSEFEKALLYSKIWCEEERFSTRPYELTSYIQGSLLDSYEDAVKTLKTSYEEQLLIKGKLSYESEIAFKNNIAYYLLRANSTEEAEKYLIETTRHIDLSNPDDNETANIATFGLLQYKIGNHELGKKLYLNSINFFKKKKSTYSARNAFLNYFREELNIVKNIDDLINLKKQFDANMKGVVENDLIFIANKLEHKFQNLIKSLV